MAKLERAYARAAAAPAVAPPKVDALPQEVLDFDTFLNTPPEYEDKRMVRDYRHEAYPKWQKAIDTMHKCMNGGSQDV